MQPSNHEPTPIDLRAVIPVAERIDDQTWLVSIEIYGTHLVVRWAGSGRYLAHSNDVAPPDVLLTGHVLKLDDGLGTEYEEVGGSSSSGERYSGDWEMEPAPPADATTLRIQIGEVYETTVQLPR